MTITIETIEKNNKELEHYFGEKLNINNDLKRTIVSFQANKKEPFYRWYKFKEGYSSALVDYVLDKLNIKSGKLIDPFAGSGTSLFGASNNGIDSLGIELLPIGSEIIKVRKIIQDCNKDELLMKLEEWSLNKPWEKSKKKVILNHLKITNGAFPPETENSVSKYRASLVREKNLNHRRVLQFALLCVLEEVSFTRKDGQYLRWDYRSGRGNGKNTFSKRLIKDFNEAITDKIKQFIADIRGNNNLFDFINRNQKTGKTTILDGSCLKLLPTLQSSSFDILMTSPPYCNRYDYTRTYALELALLGVDEQRIRQLRQEMMSCTVENKDKEDLGDLFPSEIYQASRKAFKKQVTLQNLLQYLEENKRSLNNIGISRMVKNYFYELNLIVFECARILKKNAPFVMVNDNVRYAGANIPVDLILSHLAENAGFKIEDIWVLPNGKGNSSQQMGAHGRQELRKCVYIWRKL